MHFYCLTLFIFLLYCYIFLFIGSFCYVMLSCRKKNDLFVTRHCKLTLVFLHQESSYDTILIVWRRIWQHCENISPLLSVVSKKSSNVKKCHLLLHGLCCWKCKSNWLVLQIPYYSSLLVVISLCVIVLCLQELGMKVFLLTIVKICRTLESKNWWCTHKWLTLSAWFFHPLSWAWKR